MTYVDDARPPFKHLGLVQTLKLVLLDLPHSIQRVRLAEYATRDRQLAYELLVTRANRSRRPVWQQRFWEGHHTKERALIDEFLTRFLTYGPIDALDFIEQLSRSIDQLDFADGTTLRLPEEHPLTEGVNVETET